MNLKRNLILTFVNLLIGIGCVYCQRPELPAPERRATPPPGLMPIDDYILPIFILGAIIGVIVKIKLSNLKSAKY